METSRKEPAIRYHAGYRNEQEEHVSLCGLYDRNVPVPVYISLSGKVLVCLPFLHNIIVGCGRGLVMKGHPRNHGIKHFEVTPSQSSSFPSFLPSAVVPYYLGRGFFFFTLFPSF
ncbi:hypothetical protein HOY82DRAFT_195067 [Tuber indicum]|nr:hypothetical protein HOY82DRAFT_195067 [Tuber indicum]